MYKFKTNLMEEDSDTFRQRAARALWRLLGAGWKIVTKGWGEHHLEGPNGHSVRRNHDSGNWELWHNDRYTGVSDSSHEGMFQKIKNFFLGKKKK